MKRTLTLTLIALTFATSVAVTNSAMTHAITESTTQMKQTQETQQTRLATMITKGDQEIARRLTALGKLSAAITSAVKLSSADKQLLTSEVSSATTGLTQLKSKLDAETTLDAARVDAKAIVTQYRVYALVAPKVHLVKVADSQMLAATKLTELANKLQQHLIDLKSSGKDTSTLEASLADMLAKIVTAQLISTTIQAKVIALQPTDYNSDHTILSGLNTQLKTARQALIEARDAAKSITNDMKQLAAK